ncbi:MAG: hypothetical protein CMN78_01280 [Spirochaetales bacterium]|nr:hypothetical protein [Spirochaetales bacterium]
MKRKISGKIISSIRAFPSKPLGDKLLFFFIMASFLTHVFLLSFTPQFSAIFSKLRLSDFRTGEAAPRDLFVDKDITFIDEDATTLRKEAVAGLISPIFVINGDISQKSIHDFTDFLTSFADARTRSSSAEKIYLEIQAKQPGLFSQNQIGEILDAGNVLPNLNESRIMLESVFASGVISNVTPLTDSPHDTVEIILAGDESINPFIAPYTSMVKLESLRTDILQSLTERGIEERNAQVISDIVATFARENAFYDVVLTEERRKEAVKGVNPVIGALIKGERIAQSGVQVTETNAKKIDAFGEYSTSISLNMLFGTALFVLILYLLGFILLSPPVSAAKLDRHQVYLILGIAVIYSALSVVLAQTTVPTTVLGLDMPMAGFLPTAFMTMLAAILINQRSSIIIGLLISLGLLPLTNMDPFPTLFAFFSAVAGTVVVIGAQKRLDLIRATVLLALANSIIMAAMGVLQNVAISLFLSSLAWGLVNGFVCGILNLGLLPFLEHLLNVATPFRLMELSDLNSPILKRMLTLAPGTYGHSVAVANLAESACRDIGAKPLLARVGAYYHDIGKIDQAEYFVENQTEGNKHDDLKPSLSVAVIKSHVKIGVEKAKELGLPKDVLNIIAQHHGSGLISYFYVQALKDKGKNQVSPGDYSYSGTPPVSREAAVIMLADTVEAASRTIKNPNVAKLEKFVWKTIIDKFTSQQMNNCDITFRDLEIIKRSFVHILAGNFHSRIDYPEVETKGKQEKSG